MVSFLRRIGTVLTNVGEHCVHMMQGVRRIARLWFCVSVEACCLD